MTTTEEETTRLLGGSQSPPRLSRLEAFSISVKSVVGSGIFAIPYGFLLSGWLGGTLILLACFIVTYIGVNILVQCKEQVIKGNPAFADDYRTSTYGDLCHCAFGRNGRLLVESSIMLLQLGTVIVYVIFIIETMGTVFPKVRQSLLAVSVLAVLVPVMQVRRGRWITIIAIASDTLTVLGLSLFTMLLFAARSTPNVGRATQAFGGGDWWLFIGIALFSIEGICMVLPVSSSMERPEQYRAVWTSTMVIVFIAYLTFGLVGYIAFGDGTQDIVLLNLAESPLKSTVEIIYCTALALSCPIQAVPAFEVLERTSAVHPDLVGKSPGSAWARFSLAVTSVIVAFSLPRFGKTVAVLGSISGSALAFGLPAAMLLKLDSTMSRCRKAFLVFLVGLAGIVFVIGAAGMSTFAT